MDDKQRKELISRIEHKEYVTYELPQLSLKRELILIVVLGLVYSVVLIIKNLLGKIALVGSILEWADLISRYFPFLALALVVPLIIYRIAAFAKARKAIYDLGDLTAGEKRLIQNGLLIDADYISVVTDSRGSVLKCEAMQNGAKMTFESPFIRAEFLPIDKNEKIKVFVDSANPKNYLVNIYEHIPRKGPKVLTDKTQLQYESKTDSTSWIMAIIYILVFLPMLMLLPFVLLVASVFFLPFVGAAIGIRDNNPEMMVGGIGVSIIELVIFFVIFTKSRKNRRKNSKTSRPTNYYLNAIVNRYWTTEYESRGKYGKVRHTIYHISARYVEPGTNYAYDFFATGPSSLYKTEGGEVRVFVNPNNMNKYYIDYVAAIEKQGYEYSDAGFTFDDNGVCYEK